ncbi:MAG: HAD-IB family hydrolase [Gammaproteobacteria bacterium]|nr:HAD-IB family hydrolase [Gammaproteobacteria bacterium]
MSLAIFDLDNTLLAGDSDYLWGQYLVQEGIVDGKEYEAKNQRFYDEYKAGRLDIYEFLAFSLHPLTLFSPSMLKDMHAQYMHQMIDKLITPQALALVDKHRQQGDTLMIITATNSFITRPIASAFGIPNLLATEPEMIDGRYTGKVSGIPCFQDGKVKNLHAWLQAHETNLQDSWFYSDSHNDLPLLNEVTHPVAVDPDPQLREVAEQRQWPVLQLHHGEHT